jgi:hypothetical protein
MSLMHFANNSLEKCKHPCLHPQFGLRSNPTFAEHTMTMTINTNLFPASAAFAVASASCLWTGRGTRRSNDVGALAGSDTS